METIEENLKELQSMLSDENIKNIVKGFKELVEIPKTFENYQKIVNYDTKLRQVADCLINERLIINSRESKNPDNNNDIRKFSTSLIYLKLLANKITYPKRIDIIQDVMNSPCKEEILFNYALSEDEINKRYRKLALNFHPDKTNRPNTPYSLQGDHKNLGWMFHKRNADELWKITIEYRNAAKGQWDKLKILNKDDISRFSSEELEFNSVSYGLQAYKEYRAACKIVDIAKQLKEQVRLRGNIALCLYVSNRLLEAQLYALSAIKLISKFSRYYVP
ncbi:1138_t:CDS:2 [Funneliformis caledonium]|uniref:1138_t:CDS:1 n=1 Tax=Funneliformis caledonium TaxID=1117310 RepID=A0A9N9D8M9_9GLOM|nr:1138_t:CDS:2 [Funneliformis caledonium]